MKQIEQDAIVMRQIYEKIIEVLHNNNVIYSRDNIARLAQILMAMSVNMIGMSSLNVAEFRKMGQKMLDDMAGMLDTMDPQERGKLMGAVDNQLNWFEKAYKKQEADFEDEQTAHLDAIDKEDLN